MTSEAKLVRFHIQPDSDIPASQQLVQQLQFAIASRAYPPGHRLPSTRQLASLTGLHRNTISKVYRQLEESGLVESQAGSGIYVKVLGHEGVPIERGTEEVIGTQLVQQSIDRLLSQGYALAEIREMFLGEIDWRLLCSARVLVTVPSSDIGAGKLIMQDLEPELDIPVQLVPLEELADVLAQTESATVVTSRYFTGEAEAAIAEAGAGARAIPVDIYDYSKEMELIAQLPAGSRLGLVCLSSGFLEAASKIVYSLRGDDLNLMTAQSSDTYKLNAVVRSARTIVSDRASYERVRLAIRAAADDLIRSPQIICTQNYISESSIVRLKRELGVVEPEGSEDSATTPET
ncbi:MAG: GntR family transcriptional regulator [Cyanobacteria bacterium J06641_5]